MSDSVVAVHNAIAELADKLDVLIKECDDPEAAALVELLGDVRTARQKLYGLEDAIERECVKAMFDDHLVTPRYHAERYRSRERKEWRHEDWQRDVREKAIRKNGLLNAELIDDEGTAVPLDAVWLALADVQAVPAQGAPKVTALRALGLDAGDYCSTSPGRAGVRTKPLGSEGDT